MKSNEIIKGAKIYSITGHPGLNITNNYGWSAKAYLEKPKPQLPFSERFRVFYGKDTYVLIDTEKGLLAKVKKSKEVTDDIEIAVLYLILKGFAGFKTSRINKLISAMDKPIKGCLYELVDEYYKTMGNYKLLETYLPIALKDDLFCLCKDNPRSSKRMVKCLVDNAECNRKEDFNSSFAKFAEILGIKRTWNEDLGEDIIAKYLNEVMKK